MSAERHMTHNCRHIPSINSGDRVMLAYRQAIGVIGFLKLNKIVGIRMNTERPALEVCLSPALLHLYNTKDAVVVIIDIFRATSTITAALHNGATCVIPVASVSECIELGNSIP